MNCSYSSYAIITLGGFIGAVLHKCVELQLPSLIGTLFVNFLGCVFMGIFMYESIYIGAFSRKTRLFFGVGILGAFTTFSTLAVESFLLTPYLSLLNLVLHLALGLLGIYIGRYLITYQRGI
ncbi:CrcB family protein [Methanocalculus sp.]|uniref:CrcB family protein n=1 Tax=Methanocalculus sp. TaxID=2004547 RepID=UPI0027260486|nr:CrcB family protein [Methanocalculus sp.]MDO8841503.1 CrcB family protein [Methanocalculus sp.]